MNKVEGSFSVLPFFLPLNFYEFNQFYTFRIILSVITNICFIFQIINSILIINLSDLNFDDIVNKILFKQILLPRKHQET